MFYRDEQADRLKLFDWLMKHLYRLKEYVFDCMTQEFV